MGDQYQAAMTEYVWRALSIFVPAALVVWQVNRNFRSTLRAQQEQIKRQMHLEIYREFAETWQSAVQKLNTFASAVRQVDAYLKWRADSTFRGTPPLTRDMHDVILAMTEAGDSIVNMSFVIEKYEVALPAFTSMRIAVLDQWSNSQGIMNQLSSYYIRYVPDKDMLESDKPVLDMLGIPSVDQALAARQQFIQWNELHADLLAFMVDLRTELQNHLVGPFFNNRVTPRKPRDPAYRVLAPNETPHSGGGNS